MATVLETATTASSEYIDHEPTYHKDRNAAYALPNDHLEHIRLETQAHHLSAIMNHQVIHSPLSHPLRILDVGCGTGAVTTHLATRFPSAQVYGIDLSPVPPPPSPRPANIHFLQGNIVTDRPSSWSPDFPPASDADGALFDLVFSRLLVWGMDRWPQYIASAHRLLRPGGWLEIQDLTWKWFDGRGREISHEWGWWRTMRAAAEKQGLAWDCGSRAAEWMREAGFEDVRVEAYRWPWGGEWEGEETYRGMGEYVKDGMVDMFWHLIARLMMQVGPEGEEGGEDLVRRLRDEMVKDFAPEQGKHILFYVTVGRKAGLG